MGWFGSFALVAVLCVSLGAGCTDKAAEAESNARRVAAASTADATSDVVDEARRFRLGWPGPGWKLLHEAEARKLAPEAAAGALSEGGIAAVVVVRRAATTDLGAHVAQLIDRMALAEPQVEHNEAEKFLGKDARRFIVKGTAEGVALRYAGLVFAHEGHLYRLVGWGAQADTTADGSWLEPLLKSFTLSDGAVKAPAAPATAADTVGVGWRIVDGTFESAVARLRVRPPAGFRLLVGPSLERVEPEAEVGLLHVDSGVTVLLRAEVVPVSLHAGAVERLAAQLRDELKVKVDDKRAKASIAGQDMPLLRYVAGGYVHYRGVRCAGDQCLFVQARHGQADAAAAQAPLQAAWKAVTPLSEKERTQLTDALASAPGLSNVVGKDFAIRGGVYRNFKWRLGWKKPKGFWRLAAGRRAQAINRDALLYVHEPSLGLHGLIIVEKAAGKAAKLASYHQQVVQRLTSLIGFSPSPVESTTMADHQAQVTVGEAGKGVERLRYRVVTTVHDQRAIQVLVWGWTEQVLAQAEAATAVAGGLELSGVPPASGRRGNTYRDDRLGYEIQPPAGWNQLDLTPPELGDHGSFMRWGVDGRWIAVVAACVLDPGHDEDWFVGLLEQLLRDEVGAIARGDAVRKGATLAGHPAQHVSWSAWLQRADALVLRRGKTIYALLVVDSDDEAFNLASQRFVLVP